MASQPVTTSPAKSTPIRLFVSFASKDVAEAQKLWQALQEALRAIDKNGVRLWRYDQELIIGNRWRDEINTALEAADGGILGLSSGFLTSEFIEDVELAHLIENNKLLLPVMLKQISELADLRGIDPHQIYGKARSWEECETGAQRTEFVNGLAVQITKALRPA